MTEPAPGDGGVIGVAGCGAMGLPMAERLRGAGHEVWGFDVRPAREFGAFAERMVAEAADFRARCDVVFAVVRDARQTLDLCFDAQAILAGDDAPAVFVTCSTLSPRFVMALAARMPGRTAFADAPMSGAPYRARNGSLTFMVGGDDATVARLMPLLRAMGDGIHALGPTGTGMTCKVVNNFVAATSVVAVRKALAAAAGLGLDRRRLLDVMRASSGATWYGDNLDAIDWAREGYGAANTIGILEKDVLAYLDARPGGAGAFEDALLDDLRLLAPLDLPPAEIPAETPATTKEDPDR